MKLGTLFFRVIIFLLLEHTNEVKMETFQKESCVRGYHIYQEWWEVAVGDELECQQERCTSCNDRVYIYLQPRFELHKTQDLCY